MPNKCFQLKMKFLIMLQMTKISVFTLNCWGIGMGVSRDRLVRMRAIGQHLASSSYDIVCLQEIWCPEDYETICHIARWEYWAGCRCRSKNFSCTTCTVWWIVKKVYKYDKWHNYHQQILVCFDSFKLRKLVVDRSYISEILCLTPTSLTRESSGRALVSWASFQCWRPCFRSSLWMVTRTMFQRPSNKSQKLQNIFFSFPNNWGEDQSRTKWNLSIWLLTSRPVGLWEPRADDLVIRNTFLQTWIREDRSIAGCSLLMSLAIREPPWLAGWRWRCGILVTRLGPKIQYKDTALTVNGWDAQYNIYLYGMARMKWIFSVVESFLFHATAILFVVFQCFCLKWFNRIFSIGFL